MSICLFAFIACFGIVLNATLRSTIHISPGYKERSSIDNIQRSVMTASPVENMYEGRNKLHDIPLVILVMSAPDNEEQRQTIRLTWALRLPKVVNVFFVVCIKHIPYGTKTKLVKEERHNKDLILIPNLTDEYKQLTSKVLASLKWVNENIVFDYMLKVDDDTFVRVDALLNKLQMMQTEKLYWGYFNNGSEIVKSGNWEEKTPYICDKYVSYALGGGYVLSKDLVVFIVENSEKLKRFTNEDVSIGTWLAPFEINAVHDENFRMSGDCEERYYLLHYSSVEDMKQFNESLAANNTLCGLKIRKDKELFNKTSSVVQHGNFTEGSSLKNETKDHR